MRIAAAAATLLAGWAFPAAAAPLKVGLLVTLSGPSAVLGQHIQDGFALGIEQSGGKLGGRETALLVADDQWKPDVGRGLAERLVERDRVDFVVGPVFSNILQAIFKPVTDSGAFLISANAGASTFAGKGCHPHFFSTSFQNDAVFGVIGDVAGQEGVGRVVTLVPNYQAGKDAVAGFKRRYGGTIMDELYVPLSQIDFSVELAKLAEAGPDAVVTFMPGGLGVNLVKQFRQSGLAGRLRFLSTFTVDETTLPAQGEAAKGLFGVSHWAPDLDNPANRDFVQRFEARYGYVPSYYAAQGYDAAQLIDSGLRRTGGSTADPAALRRAFEAADFVSVRGKFRYNTNHFPIQDYYLVEAVQRPDGKYATSIRRKVATDLEDPYAAECRMPAE